MKDTNNLLGHNSWSCGDYDSLAGTSTSSVQTMIVSNEHSTIGESSFKLTRIGDGAWSQIGSVDGQFNGISASADIYSPLTNGAFFVQFRYSDGSYTQSTVYFNRNDNFYSISVTIYNDSSKTVSSCNVRVQGFTTDSPVFIDNVSLIEC